MKLLFRSTGLILAGLGGLSGIAVFVVGFLAYLVRSATKSGNAWVIYDGLGRELESAPWFMRFLWIDMWPGWRWWLLDFVWFWGGLGLAYGVVMLGIMLLAFGRRP